MIEIKPELCTALEVGDKAAVLSALQNAVQLEHATIPPYLYALYSLDPRKNGAIVEIMQSVVVEEMLHMTLACNVINALGGSPQIDMPAFIPSYPAALPGAVEHQLTVGLAPFSIDLVTTVFMTIEKPDSPLAFRAAVATAEKPLTVGDFYRKIQDKIAALGDGAFSSQPRHQIGPDLIADAVVVTDVASATAAIATIVEQGEGTSASPLEVVGKKYAHYYRFEEIAKGRRLIKNPEAGPTAPPDQQYIWGGAPITVDATGIFPAPTNPKAATYPPGSAAQRACRTSSYTYTSLLRVLHTLFNGQPTQLDAAIGLMMSLKQQVKDMMMGISTGGLPAGPSFEYYPVNA